MREEKTKVEPTPLLLVARTVGGWDRELIRMLSHIAHFEFYQANDYQDAIRTAGGIEWKLRLIVGDLYPLDCGPQDLVKLCEELSLARGQFIPAILVSTLEFDESGLRLTLEKKFGQDGRKISFLVTPIGHNEMARALKVLIPDIVFKSDFQN
jgi:hypothetical protein